LLQSREKRTLAAQQAEQRRNHCGSLRLQVLPDAAKATSMESASSRNLFYRYFFYGWLFRDVGHGNLWQRSQAWRHNKEQARWLPTYMRRWLVLGVVLFGVASFVEVILSSPTLSAFFYVPSALSVPFNVVTAVCWGFLQFDRHLH
jgi:hypothetical protein